MKNFTPHQIQTALTEIASKALAAEALCSEAIAAPCETWDQRNTQCNLIVALRSVVETIGWIADHHCEPVDRQRGGAPEWLLPPVYHEQPEG